MVAFHFISSQYSAWELFILFCHSTGYGAFYFVTVQYMGATFFMVGLNQVLSIPLLQIHFRGNHDNHTQLPDWARVFFLHWLAKLLLMDRKITADAEHQEKVNK